MVGLLSLESATARGYQDISVLSVGCSPYDVQLAQRNYISVRRRRFDACQEQYLCIMTATVLLVIGLLSLPV